MKSTRQTYDDYYRTPNYFKDRRWVYSSFIKALARKAGLTAGSRLLDAGCGQGFFTALFAEQGINAVGIDVSRVAIEAAQTEYRNLPVQFEAGDVLSLRLDGEFDCVFVRSCSLYNSDRFVDDTWITDRLLRYLRPNGVLIFDYYSRLAPRVSARHWRYHSLSAVRQHFAQYRDVRVYFSLRLEAWALGRGTFSRPNSFMAALLSSTTGQGGEIVAFVRP